jgi:hypothetical protein
MHGEPLFYDAGMLCEHAGLEAYELRAAASRVSTHVPIQSCRDA